MRLDTFTIGQRLGLGFGMLIALLMLLTAIGVGRVARIDAGLHAINQVNSVKQRHAINFRGSVHDRAIELRDVVLADAPEARRQAEQAIEALAAFYATSAGPLDALVSDPVAGDPQEQQLLARINAIEAATLPVMAQVAELRQGGDVDAARAVLLEQAKPGFEAWLASIDAFIDLQESKNQAEAAAVVATATGFATVMVGLSLLAIALGVGVAWAITRSVTRPLHRAVALAEHIESGDLDEPVAVAGRDETARLLQAMNRMRGRLVDFLAAQREIAGQHEAGAISHRMDAAAFPGAYGRMAEDINALVTAHIDVKMQTVELVERYAVGDFSEDMPALPGEKARITQTMHKAKANLTSISEEVRRLAGAAAKGDFSARGDEQRYEYAYRTMVEDLNALMGTADANLAEISMVLGSLAQGDLTVRMKGDYPGVFGRIREDAHRTAIQLAEIVRAIQANSEAIRIAAGEIGSGSADLSARTESQAASLEETAASMDALTRTVRLNADHAVQANELALGAGEVAQSGGRVVGEVVTTMQAIADSSRRIEEIIGVIDAIAFQTNILALNAAVEAARAGDQGRGFAVVASEVRTLAQRSAEAAKDIKSLITASAEQVETGSKQVDLAGSTMVDIVAAVQRVTSIMGDIATASREQGEGIEQVNRTVADLERVTQQNAALVEEASASAAGMGEQADELARSVAAFRVADADAYQPASRSSRSEAGSAGRATSPPRGLNTTS